MARRALFRLVVLIVALGGAADAQPATPGGAPVRARDGELDPTYLARRARVDTAKGFVHLARWARTKRLFEEEKQALQLAVQADPEDDKARAQLEKVLRDEARHRDYRTPWRRDAKVLYVETNTSEAQLYAYCDAVSAFYDRFSKVFNVRQDPVQKWGRKIGVKIFATREDFVRYRRDTGSGAGESTVGYYSLKNKELILYHDASDPAETQDTLFHEGTHLFTHLALGDRAHDLPPWLLEGIAEYFGPSRFDRAAGELEIGRPAYGRLIEARAVLEANSVSLQRDLIEHSDYGSFGSSRYALAWGLVHMLIEKPTKPGGRRPLYRKRFVGYWAGVAAGGDSVAGFAEAFGSADALEEEWLEYIRSFSLPTYQAGLALHRAGKLEEALAMLEQHCAAQPDDPRGHYARGEVLYAAERLDHAVGAYRRAIELDAQLVDAYVALAMTLLFLDRASEAVAPAQTACEVAPSGDNYEILATVAYVARNKAVAQDAVRKAVSIKGQTDRLAALQARIAAL